jgi:6-phosphogluconolactonase
MGVAELDNLDIAIYSDIDELVAVTVPEVIEEIQDGISRNSEFHLVLTGGTLGVALSIAIANELNNGDFTGLHIWWSDERFVDLDSNDRNDLEFVNSLKNKNVVIHRAPHSGSIESQAESFSKQLENVQLDLIIIGVGPDGHVASLFPNAIYQNEKRSAFAIINSPKPPAERITFSLNEINSADEIWVVASGESKQEAIEGFMDGDMDLPVSHLKATRLLVDSAAFGIEE